MITSDSSIFNKGIKESFRLMIRTLFFLSLKFYDVTMKISKLIRDHIVNLILHFFLYIKLNKTSHLLVMYDTQNAITI
jgi:hypothetical protein